MRTLAERFGLLLVLVLTTGGKQNCNPAFDTIYGYADTPGAGATNVPVDILIRAKFDAKLDPATVTPSSFSVAEGSFLGPHAVLEGTLSVSDNYASFTPSAPLKGGTFYSVRVTTAVRDRSRHQLDRELTWSFTTAAQPGQDVVPPNVQRTSPASGEVDVSPDVALVVYFDEPLDAASVTNAVQLREDPAGPSEQPAGTTELSSDAKSFTFKPSAPLRMGSTYKATITGVRDLAGNTQAQPLEITFTVRPPPPAILGSTPRDGALHVAPGVTVRVSISGAVEASSVTAQPAEGPCSGSLQLSRDDFATCVGGTAEVQPTALLFKPAVQLQLDSTYKLRVTTAVQSAPGVGLSAPFQMGSGFRTYVVPNEKAMFMTSATYPGALGGVAGADAKCASDISGDWGNGGAPVYKALLVGGGRTACSVADCGPGSVATDWVLGANARYIRRDGTVLLDTDDRAIGTSQLQASVELSSGNFWVGFAAVPTPAMADWTTGSNHCNGWTSGSASDSGDLGWSGAQDPVQLWIHGGLVSCDQPMRLVCVEQ